MRVLDVGEQHIGPVAPVSIPPSLADGSEKHPMHGYQIGVFWDWFNDATPEVVDCCKSALNVLSAKGAEVGPSGLLNESFRKRKLHLLASREAKYHAGLPRE